MEKVVKARTRRYGKVTRALLRHLRQNGGKVDNYAQDLRVRRAQVIAKLMQAAQAKEADDETRWQVARILLGAIGINDQIEATLGHDIGLAP